VPPRRTAFSVTTAAPHQTMTNTDANTGALSSSPTTFKGLPSSSNFAAQGPQCANARKQVSGAGPLPGMRLHSAQWASGPRSRPAVTSRSQASTDARVWGTRTCM